MQALNFYWIYVKIKLNLETYARHDKKNTNDDRGATMFKEDQTSGIFFLRMVLECLENWSTYYPT